MSLTITLDDKLVAGLADAAKRHRLTIEQFALSILADATEESDDLSLEELVRGYGRRRRIRLQ